VTFLIIANLALTIAIISVGAVLGIRARRKRRRLRRTIPGMVDPSRDYAARTNWAIKPGKLNYSSFIYFDVEGDGRYGLADRPMSGVAVRLSRDERHIMTMRTNCNGFANFAMSSEKQPAQISAPGSYRFVVSVPPGWECTSGNAVQDMSFELAEGTPAGIVGREMVKPVGIAPLRTMKGSVSREAQAILRFLASGRPVGEETVQAGAGFDLAVPKAADAVEISTGSTSRILALSAYPANLGVLDPRRIILSGEEPLETIDFDGVTDKGLRKIQSGYAGLNWFNLNAISRDFQAGSEGYVNGNTSGDHMCYTSSGHPAELWRDTPFGFHSVMFSAAWLVSEGEVCIVESWRGDELAARDEITVSALAPTHYAPMLGGITRIRFSSRHHWQIVLDDLVIAR